MEEKKNIKAYLAWIAVCIIWGTTYLAIRIGVETLPPFLFAGIRWIIAGPIFLSFLLFKGYKLPTKKDFITISIVGIALIGFGNGLVVIGEQWIPSGIASLLITTTPFWIVGIEAVLPAGRRLNFVTLIGLFLGLAGVIFIFNGDLSQLFDPTYLIGVLSLLGAVAFWAGGSVYSKYNKITVHPLMSAAFQMIIAGSLQVILGLILGEASAFNLTFNNSMALLYLIFVGAIVGYGSYIYAIANLPISLVATYAYVNPIIAVFLGWLVLDERLDWTIVIAAVVILIGVAIVTKNSFRLNLRGVSQK